MVLKFLADNLTFDRAQSDAIVPASRQSDSISSLNGTRATRAKNSSGASGGDDDISDSNSTQKRRGSARVMRNAGGVVADDEEEGQSRGSATGYSGEHGDRDRPARQNTDEAQNEELMTVIDVSAAVKGVEI